MPEVPQGSVTFWIGDLKAGDQAAAQPLWERYFGRMVNLARAKLRTARRRGADADEEDAALSAFDSLCAGAARGHYPQLTDRDDLWRLLLVITARKAFDMVERERRLKRGGGRVTGEADLPQAEDGPSRGLEQVIGAEPSPEFAAMVAEECRNRLEDLGDDILRRIALEKMEGYTNEEIANRIGCSVRTVVNKLKLIRMKWERESREESNPPGP